MVIWFIRFATPYRGSLSSSTMSLLKHLRFGRTSSSAPPSAGFDETGKAPSIDEKEKGSTDGESVLEVTTAVDPNLNPGELTFEEGSYRRLHLIQPFLCSELVARYLWRSWTASRSDQLYHVDVRGRFHLNCLVERSTFNYHALVSDG